MPSRAESSRPSRSESAEESRSGIKIPSTRSGPRAKAARAATTALSTPPEIPTTTPFRRSVSSTCTRIARVISAVACSTSSESSSEARVAANMASGLPSRAEQFPCPRDPPRPARLGDSRTHRLHEHAPFACLEPRQRASPARISRLRLGGGCHSRRTTHWRCPGRGQAASAPKCAHNAHTVWLHREPRAVAPRARRPRREARPRDRRSARKRRGPAQKPREDGHRRVSFRPPVG
jgi:hypothetical protein